MWTRRIGWFVAIWAASVAALGVVAFVLRWAVRG
jgi:Protein of unknown function (DUF2474)